MKVLIEKVAPDVEIPAYATEGAAGLDLRAYSEPEGLRDFRRPFTVPPRARKLIPTGLKMAIPQGYELQIRPRSGLAKAGITVANSPGTVDSDYRGEIMVLLENRSDNPFLVRHGDRIAQGVFAKVEQPVFVEVEEVDETERGSGGFGSTGLE